MRRVWISLLAVVWAAALPVSAQAMAGMPGMPEMVMPHAASDARAAAAATRETATTAAFEVGTAERPLIARGPKGPLWEATPPSAAGGTRHGSFGAQYVAAQLALVSGATIAAGSGDEPLASRSVLTTAQATKRLSKRCRSLLKKRPSGLSKSDRKRRTTCLAQRRRIVAESTNTPSMGATTTPSTETAGSPGGSAPANPAPGSGPSAPATPDPAPTSPAGETPSGPVYAAVGVKAIDGDVPFQLTRGLAKADIVNFELTNADQQNHNLFIQQKGKPDTAKPIVTSLTPAIGGGAPTRANRDITLAPGEYELVCEVPGHGPMKVPFVVTAP